ncbi:GP88 family protein [Botrimarina mediterranea]
MDTRTNNKLKGLLRTGDPKSLYRFDSPLNPEEVTPSRIGYPRTLLSTSRKTEKGRSVGVSTKVMYLTPGALCPAASPGCVAACLGFSSGRMSLQQASFARDRRTSLFIHERDMFLSKLNSEIAEHADEARAMGLVPCVRLNGSSDVDWSEVAPQIFRRHSDCMFYDYSKVPGIALRYAARGDSGSSWPTNYAITFSVAEHNTKRALQMLEVGVNVSVVFSGGLPSQWLGVKVIDGDQHDARWLDPNPCVVGLSAKGLAQYDQTGFVVRPNWTTRTKSSV